MSTLLLAAAAVILVADAAAAVWWILLPWLSERRAARLEAELAAARVELARAEAELRYRLRAGGLTARRHLIQAAADYHATAQRPPTRDD